MKLEIPPKETTKLKLSNNGMKLKCLRPCDHPCVTVDYTKSGTPQLQVILIWKEQLRARPTNSFAYMFPFTVIQQNIRPENFYTINIFAFSVPLVIVYESYTPLPPYTYVKYNLISYHLYFVLLQTIFLPHMHS